MMSKRIFASVWAGAGLSALLATSPVRADHHEHKGPPAIRVSAEAKADAKPDRAEITVGVVTTARKAPEAAEENARKVAAVLAAMKKVLGAKADIRTVGYGLMPIQHYPEGGGTPTIKGYTATNSVRAETSDLDKVGDVIDRAMEAGANDIQNLQFSIEDESELRERALGQAAKRALAKAKALAAALDVKTGRLLSIDEGSSGGGPITPMAMARMATNGGGAPTPIEAGTIEITATVAVAVEILE